MSVGVGAHSRWRRKARASAPDLAQPVQDVHDVARLQAYGGRCVEGKGRQAVLVDKLAARDGLGDGDQKIVGELVNGREALEENVTVRGDPERSRRVIRLERKVVKVVHFEKARDGIARLRRSRCRQGPLPACH